MTGGPVPLGATGDGPLGGAVGGAFTGVVLTGRFNHGSTSAVAEEGGAAGTVLAATALALVGGETGGESAGGGG